MDLKVPQPMASRFPPSSSRPLVWAHGVGGALFLLLQSLTVFFPHLRLRFFCEPAARAAAVFLQSPVAVESGSISLAHPTIDVAITEACSGYDFFSLLIALLIGLAVFQQAVSKWLLLRDVLLIFLVVYGLTFFGNTSRIVCAVQIRATTAEVIPASFDAIIHQSIGVIVFVTLLALAWFLLTKFYERRKPTASA
jgi:exosortase K